MSRSCLNGSRKESVVPHEADVMADFDDLLDGLSEASANEFELLGKEIDDLDGSMSAGAASDAFDVSPHGAPRSVSAIMDEHVSPNGAPRSVLAIMDEQIGAIDGSSKVAAEPCTLTKAAKKKQPKKDGGCSDDERRCGLPHLSTSIGYYPRHLARMKGGKGKGGKGCGKKKGGKVAREGKPVVGKSSIEGKSAGDKDAREVVGQQVRETDTWHTYRSRVFKHAAKAAVKKSLSSDDATKFRSDACAEAQLIWNTSS